jgi:long-chain acyl-CoA synthetase
MSTCFLTGGTGFIGTYVARWFLNHTDDRIVVLVRAVDREGAVHRLGRAWGDSPDLIAALGARIEAVGGDVTEENLGLEESEHRDLVGRVEVIVHSAADIRLNAPLEELRRTNVEGVRNVLRFAEEVHADHGLQRFSHVSTAYVAGRRQGPVPEERPSAEHGFLSNYEQSKFEGEVLVHEACDLPVSVFRPGMVVGSSEDGYVRTFNTLYYPLRLYLTGKMRVVPLSSSQKVNLAPVDRVADAIGHLTLDPRAEGRIFHLVGAADSLPTVGEVVEFTRAWAKRKLGIRLPRPLYLPQAMVLMERGATENLRMVAPYLRERREFRTDNVEELLGPFTVDWQELLPRLLEFSTYNGFLHRSDRTVHEQVLFRLRSKQRPVRLHDLIDGEAVARPAEDVRRDMLRAAGALRALGVRKGDRVAIVGTNSSRYLILDVALGLVGAVSVPLYYTSPPAELDDLIEDSGSRLVLIGSDTVMSHARDMRTPARMISFCRSLSEDLTDRVTPWEAFLELGEESGDRSPVGFEDLATLRYTSSTTGVAKGVLFHHHHLRFMAECMASLPPWRVRNSEAYYLSFLPMNHVVEGILATYSLFYAPTTLNIYFLEEFRRLHEGLDKVRPTVFFSVPRFYEKLWDELMANSLAKGYLDRPSRLKRWLLSSIIRRKALKAAGLDRCDYLLSGSGPMSPEILASLRRLGIEVHNAYGLTEAPLVTINYPGRNRIGTVGEPLPRTEVAISADGEVLVKGPQVTSGYYGGREQPFREGYPLTGDIGHLTEEGSLVLDGRKKELIKTSYGKYVNPLKMETALRDIPGVFEAMIVGEGRPFCAAMVWSEDAISTDIDARVDMLNSQLSHPEQVKAWVVLPNTLSVQGGELTANMKLRRGQVMKRYARVIDAIYSGSPLPSEVLHMGMMRREG